MTGLMEKEKNRVFGRYQLGDEAGKGGMAVVFKAYDTRLEKQVALKIIRTDRISPEMANRTLKRFEREAKSAAQLEHPNIIKVLDYGKANGDKPYIVMEYLPGGTLKNRLSKNPIPWREAINLLMPMAHALQFAHERKIVHRDVKPSNILFNQAGQPVLSDFGIVKLLGDEVTQDLSSTGFMIGTPEYMSPEQATGSNFDHRVDIYALGIIFYEMVTGRRPFNADTPVGVLVKQASEPLPRPTRYNKDIPSGVENFLLKALAKDPNQRYQNMGEVIEAFHELVRSNGKTVSPFGATSTFSTYSQQDTSTATVTYDKPKPRTSWLSWLLIGGAVIALFCLTSIGAGWALGLLPFEQPVTMPTQPLVSVSSRTPTKNVLPTRTQAPVATNKPASTNTPSFGSSSSVPLRLCNNSSEDICVHSINPQPNNSLIVALIFKNNLNSSNLPYLKVGDQNFKCEILAAYPGRLYCNGPATSGTKVFTVYSSSNQVVGAGEFSVPKYVAPSPTPRRGGGGGGGNYP